jgi:hypothetical protein
MMAHIGLNPLRNSHWDWDGRTIPQGQEGLVRQSAEDYNGGMIGEGRHK